MPAPSTDANLAEVLSQWTRAFGWHDRAAFRCGDDVYTHGEVHRGGARVAGLLTARGARPGDRVAIALPGSIELVWALLGVVRIGAVALIADPGAPALPPAEHAIGEPGRHPRTLTVGELTAALPSARAEDPHPVLPGTPAYVRHTTTYAHGDPEETYLAMTPFGLRESDVLFPVPAPDEPAGLRDSVFLPLFSGASAVLDPAPRSAASVAERVRSHGATVLLCTSAFLTRMDAERPRGPFEPLRLAVSYGAAPPPGGVAEWLGCPVVTP